MKNNTQTSFFQSYGDKTAIGLSALCVVHCLLTPLLLILVPSNAVQWISDEAFHHGMLLGVLFSSIIALNLGFRVHCQRSILFWGAAGLLLLSSPLLLGHDLIGEHGEKLLTVLGASIIAIGHIKNFKVCRKHQCEC